MVDTSHAQYGCSRWSYDEKATQGEFLHKPLFYDMLLKWYFCTSREEKGNMLCWAYLTLRAQKEQATNIL